MYLSQSSRPISMVAMLRVGEKGRESVKEGSAGYSQGQTPIEWVYAFVRGLREKNHKRRRTLRLRISRRTRRSSSITPRAPVWSLKFV
jgi:hypothetical protein